MLETRELVKIYKPKKGVPVTALDKVTLTFPEKGMVFLLGKSGSGKSTLLNVLGGLDNYNGGEIIIKGVSSKDFKQKHFDSYRNTYVGFIFQEYNILDDFTVGANIALAIELQDRKAKDEEINAILKEVDLEGYSNRKPNELSGGQKQRVAIARALVKNPQIIMADEPTGALDSNTGRQIFDTLKKLSTDKLVIVVSHDREFAEQYADRIIELADGRVISDVELDNAAETAPEQEGLSFEGSSVSVPCGYHLTEEDRIAINEYIDRLKEGSVELVLSGKKAGSKKFRATDTSKIKKQDGSGFKLIKSKLPLKNAFKIGAGSLTHKKIRLAITIILSCIAFGLFGLADTFSAYDHIETCTNSLVDSQLGYVSVAKSKRIGDDRYSYWRDWGYSLSQSDLDEIKKNTGVVMQGVYVPKGADLGFYSQIDPSAELTETDFNIFNCYFSGYAEINESLMQELGFKLLAGKLPDGTKDEIAVSEYALETFKRTKYTDGISGEYVTVSKPEDLIGKTLTLDGRSYTVTAVVDTNFDIERYQSLTVEKEYQSTADQLMDYILYSEFSYASSYSYSGVAMVGDGRVEKMIAEAPSMTRITEGYISFGASSFGVDSSFLARLSDVKNENIVWLGEEKTTLGEKELIVTTDAINIWEMTSGGEDGDIYKDILSGEELDCWKQLFSDNEYVNEDGYKVVGYIDNSIEGSKLVSTVVCADSLFDAFTDGPENIYSFAVGAMPESGSDIKGLVSYCYREDSDIRFAIQNAVTYELDAVNEILVQLADIFLWVGLGFAVFAALMLANFIGTSISYKKQEIGILRAIGSRSNDVFRIFFAESFIIAMINFVLSSAGVIAITSLINYFLRTRAGILITILNFGVRQLVLLFAVSLLVAFVASYLPVRKIASKRPIDAIRNR